MGTCLLLLGFNRRYTPRFVSHFAAMARILRSNAYTNHAGSRAQYGEQVDAGARRYSKEPRNVRAIAQRLQPPPL
ncbi:hypothetical protein EMIT0P228_150173 [Pseudomonas brassicacearum]